MGTAALAFLYLPVVLWAALGLSLVFTYRRSESSTVFRLTALFLGVWALFATTALAWVLSNGGGGAVLRLARSPNLLFEPTSVIMWVAGALGAFAVFLTAFLLSQTVGRGFLRLFPSYELPWPPGLPAPSTATSLRSFRSDTGG